MQHDTDKCAFCSQSSIQRMIVPRTGWWVEREYSVLLCQVHLDEFRGVLREPKEGE